MNKIISIILFFISFMISAQTISIIDMQKNGQTALQENKVYDSIALFKQIIDINPAYFDARLGLSQAYFLIGEYQEALIHISKAIYLDKNSIPARILYARILTGTGNYQQARIIYNTILEDQKNNNHAMLGLAELEVAEGNILKAIDIYKISLSKFPENRKALISSIILYDSLKKNEISQKYVDQVLSVYPDNSYVNYIAGKHYFEASKIETALIYTTRSYDIDSDNLEVVYLLSLIHISLKNYGTAIELMEDSISKYRNNSDIWYLLGELNLKINNIDKAIYCFATSMGYAENNELPELALEHTLINHKPINDPVRKKYADYHFQRGNDLINKNLSIQARNEFRRGLQLDPHSIEGQNLYANLIKTNGYFNQYISILENIVKEKPDDIDLSDELEIYNSIISDTVSEQWGIDQFSIEVPRYNIDIFLNEYSVNVNAFNEGLYLGFFLIHSFHGYENINSVFYDTAVDFNKAFSIARESGSDYFFVFDFSDTDRSFSIVANMYHSGTGSLLTQIPVFKTGNDQIVLSLHKLTRMISESLPKWCTIIDRKFNRILLNIGNIQGISEGDIFYILRKEDLSLKKDSIGFNFDSNLLLGEVQVTKTDDLISEGVLKKYNFFDLVNPGDILIKKTDSMVIPEIEDIINKQAIPRDLYKSILSIP